MIIGIGGCSRSGKTTLSESLVWGFRLLDYKILVLHIDDFVKKIGEIPKFHDQTDWEIPKSIDLEFLNESIAFYENKVDYLIVEGYHFFNFKELVEKAEISILINIDKKTFINRRNEDKRWGNVDLIYLHHVWYVWKKNGKKHLIPSKTIKLNGNIPFGLGKIIVQITSKTIF